MFAFVLFSLLAFRDGADVVVVPERDYSHIEITTDPPCEFVAYPDGSLRGTTTATEGEFFGVICDGSTCVPQVMQFHVGEKPRQGERPNGDKLPLNVSTLIVVLLLLAVSSVTLFTVYVFVKGVMRGN